MARKNSRKAESDGIFMLDSRTKAVMAQPSQDGIKEKVFAVREVVPNRSNNEIVLVLQYYDYSVEGAIQAFLEDGAKQALLEWHYPGNKPNNKKKKKKQKKAKEQQQQLQQQQASGAGPAAVATPTAGGEPSEGGATSKPTQHAQNSEKLLTNSHIDKQNSGKAHTGTVTNGPLLPEAAVSSPSPNGLILGCDKPSNTTPTPSPASSTTLSSSPSSIAKSVPTSSSNGPNSNSAPSSSRSSPFNSRSTPTPSSSSSTPTPSSSSSAPSSTSSAPSTTSSAPKPAPKPSSAPITSEEAFVERMAKAPPTQPPKRPSTLDTSAKSPRERTFSELSSTSSVSSSTTSERVRTKPYAGLEKSLKDLQRQTTSLQRLKLILTDEVNKSYKLMTSSFDQLRLALNEREAEVMFTMDKTKKEADEMLHKRQLRAKQLRQCTDRAQAMSEPELAELRADIKHFVSERKLDEDVTRAGQFVGRVDELLQNIHSFGEVSLVKTTYSERRPSVSSVSSSVMSHDDLLSPTTPTSPVFSPVYSPTSSSNSAPFSSPSSPDPSHPSPEVRSQPDKIATTVTLQEPQSSRVQSAPAGVSGRQSSSPGNSVPSPRPAPHARSSDTESNGDRSRNRNTRRRHKQRERDRADSERSSTSDAPLNDAVTTTTTTTDAATMPPSGDLPRPEVTSHRSQHVTSYGVKKVADRGTSPMKTTSANNTSPQQPPPRNNHESGFRNNHDLGHRNNHESGHRNQHESGHRNNHESGHRNNHESGHRNNHESGHRNQHESGHRNNHESGHRNNHESGHRNQHESGHRNNHESGHRNNHEAGHRNNQDSGYRNRGPRNHKSDQQSRSSQQGEDQPARKSSYFRSQGGAGNGPRDQSGDHQAPGPQRKPRERRPRPNNDRNNPRNGPKNGPLNNGALHSDSRENAGRAAENAGKAAEKAGKGAENAGKGGENARKGENAGRAENARKGGENAGRGGDKMNGGPTSIQPLKENDLRLNKQADHAATASPTHHTPLTPDTGENAQPKALPQRKARNRGAKHAQENEKSQVIVNGDAGHALNGDATQAVNGHS